VHNEETDSIRAELAELRTQFDALREREAAKVAEAETLTTEPVNRGDGRFDEPEKGDPVAESPASRVHQIINGLDRELAETKPTRLLAVFAVGIIIGRLLPR
jgi:hypothetical protein